MPAQVGINQPTDILGYLVKVYRSFHQGSLHCYLSPEVGLEMHWNAVQYIFRSECRM